MTEEEECFGTCNIDDPESLCEYAKQEGGCPFTYLNPTWLWTAQGEEK